MGKFTLKDITQTSAMAAIVFIAVSIIKVPTPNGYTHIGDSMILLGVVLLGTKKGAIAGGLGAALADFIGGYMQWVFPTFIIKFLMGIVLGFVITQVMPNHKYNWVIGGILGSIVQIIGYATVESIYYGLVPALTNIPSNIMQSIIGIIIAGVLIVSLDKNGFLNKIRSHN